MESIILNERKKSIMYTILEYIVAIMVVFSTNTVYYSAASGKLRTIMIAILFTSIILMMLYNIWILSINKNNILPYIIFAIGYIIYMGIFLFVNSRLGNVPFVNILILLIYPLLLVFIMNNESVYSGLLVKIHRVIVVIAVISLIFWGLSFLKIPTNMSVMVSWGEVHPVFGYYGLDFLAQGKVDFLGMNFIRNTGLFTEAPMYAYVLCVALLINLFVLPKKHRLSLVILIVTMISTGSTTALIIMLLSLTIKFIIQAQKNRLLKVAVVGVAVVVGIFILDLILQYKQITMQGSYSLRTNDIASGWMAWKLHPFFGNGFNLNVIENFMSTDRLLTNNVGYSSGIFLILSVGGIYLLLIYVLPVLIALIKKYHRMIIIAVMNILLLAGVIVPFTFLCMTIVFYPIALYVWNIKEGN